MSRSILGALPELVDAGLIDQSTATRIRQYYDKKAPAAQNRLFIVFGILGALLVGLGLILIIGHNWEALGKPAQTVIAFAPMVLGQLLGVYVLLLRPSEPVWREGTAIFLFFAVGGCISLIGQIYQVPGTVSSFLLTWMLLVWPLMYVLRSSVSSLLYLIGITWYACDLGYGNYPGRPPYLFWPLLLVLLPHYYYLYRQSPRGNFTIYHHWLVPLALVITLGTLADAHAEMLYVAYLSLFGAFYQLGRTPYLLDQKLRSNGYLVWGTLGTVVVLLSLSFDWFWKGFSLSEWSFQSLITAREFTAAAMATLAGLVVLGWRWWQKKIQGWEPTGWAFLVFLPIFFLGAGRPPVALGLINLLILAIGIYTIRRGAKEDHLLILNAGLLILTALVVCRFFDADLSFITRGLLFVLVGAGFFAANYWMIRKRRRRGSDEWQVASGKCRVARNKVNGQFGFYDDP